MGSPSPKMNDAANVSTNSNRTKNTASRRVGKWEWERGIRKSGMPPEARHFCLTVNTYMNVDGAGAFPTVDEIAEAMGVSPRSAQRAKSRAKADGYLSEVGKGGRGKSCRYLAVVPKGDTSDALSSEETVTPAPETTTPATEKGDASGRLPDQEQTIEQTTPAEPSGWRESQELETFLDAWSAKLDPSAREHFEKQRRSARNKHKLKEVEALASWANPYRMATDLWRSKWDNRKPKSPLGYLLAALRKTKEDRGRVPRNNAGELAPLPEGVSPPPEVKAAIAKITGRSNDAFAGGITDHRRNQALDQLEDWQP